MRALLERRFSVAAPPSAVWERLADVGSWPSWARHIKGVRLRPAGRLGPSTTGSFRLSLLSGLRVSFQVTHFDRGRSWTWRGRVLWLTVDYGHELHSEGPTTDVVFRVSAGGPAAGSLGRLFAAGYRRKLDRAIPRFVAQFSPP